MKRIVVMTVAVGLSLTTSSALAGWETHTDRPGMNLRSFPLPADTEVFEGVRRCEEACRKDPKCRSFTYVNAGIQGPKARCHLKKGVPAQVKNKHCTSGVVRPTTKAGYCGDYARTAVERAKGNKNYKCGYGGPRWSEDQAVHYGWCMKSKVADAQREADERARLMKKCLVPTNTGDLAAHDWCYRIHPAEGRIEFRPVIKNIKTRVWRSTAQGYYKVGVTSPLGMSEKKMTLAASPQWDLAPGAVEVLDGLSLVYKTYDIFQIRNLWVLSHPHDERLQNNLHPGADGYFKGRDFNTNPTLTRHHCRYYGERNTWAATPAPKRLEVHVDIDTIEVIDEGDGSGNAEPYLWAFFFEIDDQLLIKDRFYDASGWSFAPGGSHGNIGGGYDAGHVRLIPAKYGHWKTVLTANPLTFPKKNAHVGVVLVLIEEDKLPSSTSIDDEHYPYFKDLVSKRLQCMVLQSLEAELRALQAKKSSTTAAFKLLYDGLVADPRAKGLGCPEATGAYVSAHQGSAGGGFSDALARAERALQETIVAKLQNPIPWFLRFIPKVAIVSAFANVDDYIGSRVLLWSWERLEEDPFRVEVIRWDDSTGSEDGAFVLRVHVKAYPLDGAGQ